MEKLAGAPHWLLTMTLCRGWYLGMGTQDLSVARDGKWVILASTAGPAKSSEKLHRQTCAAPKVVAVLCGHI